MLVCQLRSYLQRGRDAELVGSWSLAARAGRDPHWIADQIGHTSAAFTLQVYQQTRNRRLTDRERQAIWELMRFADEPAECPFTRQVTRADDPEFRPVNGPMGNSSPPTELDDLSGDG